MKKILLLFVSTYILSCSEYVPDKVHNIISNDDLIKSHFLTSSLFVRNSYFVYEIYYFDSIQIFYISTIDKPCKVIRDSTIFDHNNSKNYALHSEEVGICDSVKKLIDIMKKFSIVGYRSDWRNVGIDLKIYLNKYEIFYVSNKSKFLFKYKDLVKVNENWYYRSL